MVLLGLLVGAPATAAPDDDAVIETSQVVGGSLRLLVSLPEDDAPATDAVDVTIGSASVTATVTSAGDSDAVTRTTVLAVDTSLSMRGPRLAAAQKAATQYLKIVPKNVKVGLVTFDDAVRTVQPPTTDRGAVRGAIETLELRSATSLYQGVGEAVRATGNGPGQRQVLLLSDGRDSTGSPLAPVLSTLKGTDVTVDVVALDQGTTAPPALRRIAEVSGGSVIAADTTALTAAFSRQAQALARQVVVTADLPAEVPRDASVEVTLRAGTNTYRTSAFVALRQDTSASSTPPAAMVVPDATTSSFELPPVAVYIGIGALALGAMGVIAALAIRPAPQSVSLADQLQVYGATAEAARRARITPATSNTTLTDQARKAAQNVLANNEGVESGIAKRLEGAGMALKASEWLLLHVGIAFGAGLFGLLLSGGNPIAMVLLLVLGAVGPWVYLGLKRSRRLKAFDSSLADTLQLMSSSLSAGLSLAQSMDTIVREGNEPITSEFKRAIVESRLGVGLEDALDGVADRMESTDFRWVVMAIRIQREVGGNLAELLNTVAGTLREREYIRRHVQALSAEGRLSCWILGLLPPLFLGYLTLTRFDYVRPMFTTPIGILLDIVMGILLAVGVLWMSRVSKVEV